MATVDRLTLEIWNGTQYADLTDLISFNTRDFRGTGVPQINNLTQRGPSQNGSTFLGSRYQERVVQLVLDGKGSDDSTMHDRRAELSGLFQKSSDLLQLRYSVPPDRQYQLDCYVSVPPDFRAMDRDGYIQRTVVELRAPDPTWYNPDGIGVPFQIAGGGSGWTLNSNWSLAANGWTFGTSILNQTEVISMNAVNAAESFPIITLIGPITDPKVLNLRTGLKLDFTGYTIGGGVSWVANTRFASKSVDDNSGVAQISKLTDDSSLATFSLLPGDNPIAVTGTSISTSTQVSVQYYERFTGV